TIAQTSAFTYNVADSSNPHRWGDFSVVTLDPNDNMTMWTAQEYCNATDSWGVRVIQLRAPPPAIPSSSSPASVPQGKNNTDVIVTATSSSGSGFFDPGPAFVSRISASISGNGVTINNLSYT